MAFLPTTPTKARDKRPERARLHVAASGRLGDRRRLTFVLSQPLVDRLGWQTGDRLSVDIGVAEDLGAFRIFRSRGPGTGSKLMLNSNSGGARLHVNLAPEIDGFRPAEMIDLAALPVDFDVATDGGALILTTPKGATWISAGQTERSGRVLSVAGRQ